MAGNKKAVDALIILDGWGINPSETGNAVALANTPFLDSLLTDYPVSKLACSGEAVGLPNGIMGNSEVGHMNIGAGRKVFQDLVRINHAIKDGSFFKIQALVTLMEALKSTGRTLHLMGLLSDGGVHSHMDHLFALIDMAALFGIEDIAVHPILDGRDTPPKSGFRFITDLEEKLLEKGCGRIATLCGRFYAMDRDTRWERVNEAFSLYTLGMGIKKKTAAQAMKAAYEAGQTDEFIKPVLIADDHALSPGTVNTGDGLIFFNFRADRAREITRAFTETDFSPFKREKRPELTGFLCMTRYDEAFDLPVIYEPQQLDNVLGKVIASKGHGQLRIAETEKYAHVTYFFNGGDETVFPGEERILIPSPREVATYDEKPQMSATEVADTACELIESGRFSFMVLNFANMDMVGHTGIVDAGITACETVDGCVRQVVETIWKTGGSAMVTADHGNAEQMMEKDGSPHTAHTLNPVRFILTGEKYRNTVLKDGILGDIAPTVLKVMGIDPPDEMTGKALF